jgi:hypothetical protein
VGLAGLDALDGEVVELFGGLGRGGALGALLGLCFGHLVSFYLFLVSWLLDWFVRGGVESA